MPQPIIIPFQAETSEAQKNVDALTASMTEFKGSFPGDELGASFQANMAKVDAELSGLNETTKEASVEQKAFGDHVSSARTAMGKLSFAAAAVAGGIKIATDAAKDFASAVEDTPEFFDSRQVKIAEDYNTQITLLSVGLAKQKEPFAVAITGWAKVGNTLLIADEAYKAVFRATGDVAEAQRAHHRVLTEGTTRFAEIEAATRSSDQAMLVYAGSAGETSIAIRDLAEEQAGLEKEMLLGLSAGIRLTDITKKYEDRLESLNERLAEEREELSKLEGQYGTSSEKIDAQRGKVEDLEGAVDDLQIANQNQTDKWIANLIAQSGASIDFQIAYAEHVGLVSEESANAANAVMEIANTIDFVSLTAEQKKLVIESAMQGIALSADDPRLAMEGIGTAIENIPSNKTVEILITTLRQEIIQPIVRLTGASPGFAAGVSDFIVPPGYQNDAFPMRVSSGERVNVETKPQQSQGSNRDETNKLLKQLIDKEAINVDMLTIAFRDAMLIGAQ